MPITEMPNCSTLNVATDVETRRRPFWRDPQLMLDKGRYQALSMKERKTHRIAIYEQPGR